MTDEFIESLESELRLNNRGVLTAAETLDYIKMHLDVYKRQRNRLYEHQETIEFKHENNIFF